MSLLTWGGEPLTWGGEPLTWGPYTPPASPIVDVDPVADWVWSVGPGASSPSSAPEIDLVGARGRVITWRTRGHAFAQFTIDARDDGAASIIPQESDLWVYRNSRLVFRGRVTDLLPDVAGTPHLWNVVAVDYRQMLTIAAAVEPPVPVFSGVDQGAIAWQLVAGWQALPGANWGITDGLGAVSGTLRDETDILVGSPVGDVIDRLADREGGFEWEVSPELVLNRWHPRRERNLGVVLDLSSAAVVRMTGSPSRFLNVAVVTGAELTTPVVVAAADVATDPRGRWSAAFPSPTVSSQDTLAAKGAFAIAEAARAAQPFTVELAPNRWAGPDGLWIGDTVQLAAVDGALSIAGPRRVVDLSVSCGDRGDEVVRVGLVGV